MEQSKRREYINVRRRLLQENCFFKILIQELTANYKIPIGGLQVDSFNKWLQKKQKPAIKKILSKNRELSIQEARNKLELPIRKLANILDVDLFFVEDILFFNKLVNQPYYVHTVENSWDSKSIDPGVYIKYTPFIDWKEAQRQAMVTYHNVFEATDEKEILRDKRVKRKSLGYNLTKNELLYRDINSKMLELLNKKLKYGNQKIEDVELKSDLQTVLRTSIEQEALKNVGSDENKEVKEVNRLKGIYFRISKRYLLPTIRDFGKLRKSILMSNL